MVVILVRNCGGMGWYGGGMFNIMICVVLLVAEYGGGDVEEES